MPAIALLAAVTLAFAPAPSWHARSARARDPSPPCALAATVPLREAPCAFPHRTVAALPPTGIAIWAVDYGDSPNAAFRARRLPLRLAGTPLQHNFEGLACNCGFQQILARVRGHSLWVFVVYNRMRPLPAQEARAATEVARLALE